VQNGTLALLAGYEINIRSFHPEKSFGWSGMKFEGDNRGFSLQPSGKKITSRIWHKVVLETGSGHVFQEVKSDKSKAPWSDEFQTYIGELAPRNSFTNFSKKPLKNHIKSFSFDGAYWGVNHAMPFSPELQRKLGGSYVPTLNVHYKVKMDIDRVQRHIDLVVYITGDAFPNCEAFIIGPGGAPIFLGVHVRKGSAPVSLAMNLRYPMIACAIRIPINADGSFSGKVGDELARRSARRQQISYQPVSSWNEKFLNASPNNGRCMWVEDFSFDGCFS
jgi:hypothetical protein